MLYLYISLINLKMKETLINTVHVERARFRISQKELAKIVGCSRQTIYSIEKGRFEPSTKISLKIAAYFELKVEDIFSLINEEL